MIKKGILIIGLMLIIAPFSFGKGGVLDMVISVDIKSTPVKVILTTIEKKAQVSFTYNPGLIDENRLVSLSIKEKTIRYGLSLIFDETVRFKEVGSHIILLKNEDRCRKRSGVEFTFSGKIVDSESGKPINNASIYEVDDHYATVSDQNGHYTLSLPASQGERSLYFKKVGYRPEVTVVSGKDEEVVTVNVQLHPVPEDIRPIETTGIRKLDLSFEELALSGALVSKETVIHGENLPEVDETRWAQISLVPAVSFGSNLSTNALINNHFSFNILAGYSKGVRGSEIGSIANLVKENVIGAEICGITNMVGGNVLGAQVAGISNMVQGNVTGAQVAGISNIMKRDLTGVQVSGISSIVRGGFNGGQFSGIANIAFENSVGAQVSGIYNQVKDSLIGGQISGIANFSNGGINFLQVSGISNFADVNRGLQVSGIQNFSRKNNGLQIGLINSSIEGKGVAIGLFNFVKKGYHKTEISANEIFPVNLSFKTGTQRLYNIYTLGARFGTVNAYALGTGFGSYFSLSKRFQLSLDLTEQLVFENDFEKFEFDQLFKLSTTLDIRLAKWVSFFIGPSANVNFIQFKDSEGLYSTNISFLPLSDHSTTVGRTIFWIGGQAGFRF